MFVVVERFNVIGKKIKDRFTGSEITPTNNEIKHTSKVIKIFRK